MKAIPFLANTAVVVAGFAVTSPVFAGSVGPDTIISVMFSGPGGTGADGGIFSNTTEPRFFFSSLNYIDMTITVSSAGSYDINEAPGLGFAQNNTGQTWTGFTISMINDGGIGTLTHDWADYPTNNAATYGASPPTAIFASENIPTSSSFAFTGDFTTSGSGTVVFRETPIVPTPEPSALALIGIAGIGLQALRRRRPHLPL